MKKSGNKIMVATTNIVQLEDSTKNENYRNK